MATNTGIEWTDATWNPIRGCSRVSEGCRHCYAESVAYRFSGPGQPYEGLVQLDMHHSGAVVRIPKWNGKIKFVEEHLLDPLRWRKPRRIFVNSMSDLFHENVTDAMRDKIFAVMALCPQHTFQVLTKRPERMLAYMSDCPDNRGYSKSVTNPRAWNVWCEATKIQAVAEKPIPGPFGWTTFDDVDTVKPWPLANVHLGVSVENQKAADERIPLLLQAPAAKRFISAEPLLGAVDLRKLHLSGPNIYANHAVDLDGLSVRIDFREALNWVIVGGESGAGARPMHPEWARSLRDQCKAAGVPFFFKQWGEWGPYRKDQNQYGSEALVQTKAGYKKRCRHIEVSPGGTHAYMQRVGKKAAGALLDGVEHREFPA